MMFKKHHEPVADIDRERQYRPINELISESRPNGVYYLLLILSSVIVVAGILLANPAIIVGGVLVTPILTPILLIALGIIAGKPKLLKRTSLLVLKSILIVFLVSIVMASVFSVPSDNSFFNNPMFASSLNNTFLYFLVAFSSGIAATYALVRKDVSSILPGISIAVSLVPPISIAAVWMADKDFERAKYFLLVFFLNLVATIIGSIIVFSMHKSYRVDGLLKNRIKSELEREKLEEREEYLKEKNKETYYDK